MDERAPIVLTKIVVLLFVFPLCQLGSEFKIQSAAELSGYHPTSPSGTVNVSRLPNEEVEAFNKIVLSLEVVPVFRMKETSCDEDQFLSSIFIGCTESDNNNERHINNVTMESARLTGKIPEYVTDLKYLEKLDLSNNKLRGSIPDELGDLSNLTILDLSQNRLTGNIPSSLGKLKNLRELSLFQNLLSGNIPASLGSLSSLTILRLWANVLSGPIPAELGNLTQLRRLALDENGLTGKAPPELGKLRNLRHLGISSNNIIGELPKEYDSLRNLEIFGVGGNSLSGAIPRYIANWKNLSVLDLIGNDFKGELPREIFNMSNLEILKVANLKNPGLAFPISANLTSIFTLILRDCNITGVIPSYISDWSNQSLKNLDLTFNDLSGGIPDGFKQGSLYKLFLTGNMLDGTFPTWISETVEVLGDLSYNNFTFPDELQMDLGYNNSLHQTKINIEPRNKTFDQEIMQKHCNRGKPKYHSLFINAGAEEITIERNRYEADNSTSNFYVSPEYNWAYSCSGHFLQGFTNSSDFVAKQKCGVFFNAKDASLHSKARLCPQSLTYYGFCLHEGSYNVTLHFSEIIFSRDEDLSSPGKRVFDIYIQDKLELKDFNIKEDANGADETLTKNFTVHVTNNLLKIKLLWNGKGSKYRTTYLHGPLISAISVTPNFKVGGKSKIWIMEIALASVALGLLLLVLMWRMGWIGDRELHVNRVMLRGQSYTLKQVKDATRNFSRKNEIGKGRYGIVYKAELPDDQIVAVKKLSPEFNKVIDQLATEVYALKKLENENVVELFDGYSKGDLHLLIYEYMGKGSLQRALFEPNSEVKLQWPTRVRICLEIAKGLKYLHDDDNNKLPKNIIHRNIRPSNILLDENLHAKVADFGLAKIYDEVDPYSFIQTYGKQAYMAPEYWMRKAITEAVDVFSFGIVLLEIVSGQSNATSYENHESTFLLNTAFVEHRRKRLFALVDKNISISDNGMKQAIDILELAMKCVDQSPTLRPTMIEVASELEKISNVNTSQDESVPRLVVQFV